MAFNINAQVMLSGPKNIKAVTNKIQKQLGGITATVNLKVAKGTSRSCLLYTSPSPRDGLLSRMPSTA